MKKLLSGMLACVVAGCASAPPQASVDWNGFIASVPGEPLRNEADYKTPALKRSLYRANSEGLNQVKARFEAWCKAHQGKALSGPSLLPATRAFSDASSAWFNQVFVATGERYTKSTLFCVEAAGAQQLIAAMLIDAYNGHRGGPYEPERWPAPVLAFYTPEQAAGFAGYYNQKEKERSEAGDRASRERSDRQAQETQRLRTSPKIGDVTLEGMIVDLRPPLALLQYNALQRQMFGKPQTEWVPISSLNAPRPQ